MVWMNSSYSRSSPEYIRHQQVRHFLINSDFDFLSLQCQIFCPHNVRYSVLTMSDILSSQCQIFCPHNVRYSVLTMSDILSSQCQLSCPHNVRYFVLTMSDISVLTMSDILTEKRGVSSLVHQNMLCT